jgi:hypothetical protein
MRIRYDWVILFVVALFTIGCGCNDHPDITTCTDSVCPARKDETQLTCNCTLDVSGAGETFTSSVDQVFNLAVCLPPSLNLATANDDQRAAIEDMTADEFSTAASAYCQTEVAGALRALIGVMTGSDQRACDNVVATCAATPVNDGRATSVNATCDAPCATTTCDGATCPGCEVNEGCNDPSLRGVHPEQCKCTQAEGCGVSSADVCTVPTWAPDPPETAVGWLARQLSQPTDIEIDHDESIGEVTVSVDPGVPCSSDSDTANPHIGGTVSLFGTPCPGEECDMLIDFELVVDNFGLNFSLGALCPDGFVDATALSVGGGGEGVHVHLGTDGCGVMAPGELRVVASSVLNLNGDVERRTFDAANSEPVPFCVDFTNNTFQMLDVGLTFEDGSVSMDLVGDIVNQPPLAIAGAPQVVECDQELAGSVTLDGTGSSDPDGSDDFRSFVWWKGAAFDPTALVGFGPTLATVAPFGTTDYELTVADLRFTTMASRTQVTVADTTGPTITASVTPTELWPPNHKMVPHTVSIGVTDVCDPSPTFVLKSIVSNEPDNDTGDGNTVNDIQGADFGTPDVDFSLRAERKGNGTGRQYTITYTATDSSGNSTDAVLVVSVPHDQGK